MMETLNNFILCKSNLDTYIKVSRVTEEGRRKGKKGNLQLPKQRQEKKKQKRCMECMGYNETVPKRIQTNNK